ELGVTDELLLEADAVVRAPVRDERALAEDRIELERRRRLIEEAGAALERRPRSVVGDVLPDDDARRLVPLLRLARVVRAEAGHDACALERRHLELAVGTRRVDVAVVLADERGRADAAARDARLLGPRKSRRDLV